MAPLKWQSTCFLTAVGMVMVSASSATTDVSSESTRSIGSAAGSSTGFSSLLSLLSASSVFGASSHPATAEAPEESHSDITGAAEKGSSPSLFDLDWEGAGTAAGDGGRLGAPADRAIAALQPAKSPPLFPKAAGQPNARIAAQKFGAATRTGGSDPKNKRTASGYACDGGALSIAAHGCALETAALTPSVQAWSASCTLSDAELASLPSESALPGIPDCTLPSASRPKINLRDGSLIPAGSEAAGEIGLQQKLQPDAAAASKNSPSDASSSAIAPRQETAISADGEAISSKDAVLGDGAAEATTKAPAIQDGRSSTSSNAQAQNPASSPDNVTFTELTASPWPSLVSPLNDNQSIPAAALESSEQASTNSPAVTSPGASHAKGQGNGPGRRANDPIVASEAGNSQAPLAGSAGNDVAAAQWRKVPAATVLGQHGGDVSDSALKGGTADSSG